MQFTKEMNEDFFVIETFDMDHVGEYQMAVDATIDLGNGMTGTK